MTALPEVLRAILALVVGFVLGSVLPARLLARRSGVDIASVGDGNPGTWNAFAGVGVGAGVITLAYDVSVGVVAIGVASLLGVAQGIVYLAGLMAVVGHRFPVFHRFRGGGQGMAASAGMVVYGVVVALFNGWLAPIHVVALLAIGVATFVLTRSPGMVAIVVLPTLLIELVLGRPEWRFLAFMAIVTGYIWTVQVAARWERRRLGTV